MSGAVNPSRYMGKRYGILIVTGLDVDPSRADRKSRLICQCDCGNQTLVSGPSLTTGNTKSCGCDRKKVAAAGASKSNIRHGQAVHGNHYGQTPTYQCWVKVRCLVKAGKERMNPFACHEYDARWNSYQNFYEDFGDITPDQTISRVDKKKPWSKGNCYVRTNVKRATTQLKRPPYTLSRGAARETTPT